MDLQIIPGALPYFPLLPKMTLRPLFSSSMTNPFLAVRKMTMLPSIRDFMGLVLEEMILRSNHFQIEIGMGILIVPRALLELDKLLKNKIFLLGSLHSRK